jgi:methylated-DNA-[protein]-cysteine S-methyltransferase
LSTIENRIEEGPDIEVTIEVKEGIIQSVSLVASSSKGMKWKIISSFLDADLNKEIDHWLKNYALQKNPIFSLPLNWGIVSPFTREVLKLIENIPFGCTMSYGKLAVLMNCATASRAVGGACGRNPFPLFIPCHRVLSSNHQLTGFSEGIEIKRSLLIFERSPFVDLG